MRTAQGARRPTILLVDDSPTQREMLQAVLAAAGYRVIETSDGADALSKLSEAAELGVDAIVADGEMPIIDGYQLCRLVKADSATAHLPFVLLTVQPQGFRRLRAQTCGADLFAPKGSAIDIARLPEQLQGLILAAPPPQPEKRRRPKGDLSGWLGHLARTVEHSLLESTLRRRVAALYDGSHDVQKTSEAFLELMEDFVLPGAIAVAYPYLDGWRVAACCGVQAPVTLRDALAAELVERGILAPSTELPWTERTSHGAMEFDATVSTYPVGVGRDPADGLVVVGADAWVFERSKTLFRAALDELGRVFHIERAHLEIYRAAVRDALTGAWNRRYMTELMEREICRVRRYGGDLTAILVDIDHFKQVNDEYGHVVGDEVLQIVASRLGTCIRTADTLARLGGEEFLVLCPHTSPQQAIVVAERLRLAIGDTVFAALRPEHRVTISIGVAGCDASTKTVQNLLASADAELYRAKKAGRNRVSVAAQL